MLPETITYDKRLQGLLKIMANDGIRHAAEGLSSMVGEVISVAEPDVQLVPLSEVSALAGGPEQEAVGIYLQSQGELTGQIMLVIAYDTALELVDLLLENPPGTTTLLGRMERSALQEIGNLTGSFFLNSVARRTGHSATPSPPAVMVDMVGAISDIVVAISGGVSDYVLLLKGAFLRNGRELKVNFWMIPDAAALAAFATAQAEGVDGQ
jgi:chemotaxis protein CheC